MLEGGRMMGALPVWVIWMAAGLLLMIAELLTVGFVAACMGAAAILTGLVVLLFPLGLNAQLFLFICFSILLLARLRPLMDSALMRGEEVRTNVDALVGMEGRVVEPVGGEDAPGRVKVRSEEWRAVLCKPGEEVLRKGSRVVVEGIEGNTLKVRPLVERKGE